MIHNKQGISLDKALKWMKTVKTRRVAPLLLSAVIITSAGAFSTTARATDKEAAIKDSMLKACFAYYDGHNIGAIAGKENIEDILENIRQEYEDEYNMETILASDIEYEDIYIDEQFLSDISHIEKILRDNIQPRVKSTLIQIDGQDMAILKDEKTAKAILDAILEPYKEKAQELGNKLEEIGFAEEVTLKEEYVEYESLEDPREISKEFTEGDVERQIYVVEEGDNVWTIAEKHDISVWDLLEANAPAEESDILQIGQELYLNVPDLPLNVLTTEKVEFTESVPFETEKKETDSLYINQTKVSQEGQKGENSIVERIYKRNGIVKERDRVSEKVIKEPVKEIILVGTKQPVRSTPTSRGGGGGSQNVSGSGSMVWPTKGNISSRFGRRWGRLHAGIDIAAPKGTPIYAADSGNVSYSAYSNGGYGNLVKINHGGGIITYYAHMSSRAVGKGASVKKGELIGYVGSTGRSTGPHLHFEVRVGGSPKNPMGYLK